MTTRKAIGKVYLVGGGPGDVELITVKAVRCLQRADVVMYDFHVNSQLLAYAKPDAELIFCGKHGGFHEISQDEINRMLVEKASAGRVVCRLKAGDPFVFGRGGEEGEFLFRAGIDFEVIPGVTAASAVPAYAGIPLTHRHAASSFTVVTGSKASAVPESIDYSGLIYDDRTLIFLMAAKNLEAICANLLKHGEQDMPAALIQWGTRAEQKTVTGTLETLPGLARKEGIGAPAVLVVGKVVGLRKVLQWYERKPLFGERVLITGPRPDDYDCLEELGAELFWFPTAIRVAPDDYAQLDARIENIRRYDWIIFPDHYSIEHFFHRFTYKGCDIRTLNNVRLCSIGDRTLRAATKLGLRPELALFYLEKERVEQILSSLYPSGLHGLFFLFAGEQDTVHPAEKTFRELGANVDRAPVYRVAPTKKPGRLLKRYLKEQLITCAIFESPEEFSNLKSLLNAAELSALGRIIVAVLDPPTQNAVERAGLQVAVVPEEATIKALGEAIAANQGHHPGSPA